MGRLYSVIACLPLIQRLLVFIQRFYPALTIAGDFFFPERRTVFQVIHDVIAGVEGGFAVGAADANKYNLVGYF